MKQIFWISAGAIVFASWAAAQQPSPDVLPDKAKAELEKLIAHSKMIGREGMTMSSAVTGAPYSAEEVTKFTQTLGDGTRIQREDRVSVYRDGQGRVRRESPNEITIMDAGAGVGYVLDPKAMKARKIAVSVFKYVRTGDFQADAAGQAKADAEAGRVVVNLKHEAGPGPANVNVMIQRHETMSADANMRAATELDITKMKATAAGPNANVVFFSRDTISHASPGESLGQQSIEGVMSEGTRVTETIPAGAIGNDRAIQTVTERWYSPELKTVTMTRRNDPRSGEEIFRLTNVRRGEPSPDLFQLPAGYQVLGQ